ncbi:MAG: nucleoside phosphorylase [Bacteroidia bacterium]
MSQHPSEAVPRNKPQTTGLPQLPADSELIVNAAGEIYHLSLAPGEAADRVILVGDPHRVDRVAARFDTIEVERSHREFRTATGLYRGVRMSVISTGIGTDNIDIVLNELDALFNIDFSIRQPRPETHPLRLLRLGTCGGIQPEAVPGTLIYSAAAIGGDNLLRFYQPAHTTDAAEALQADWERFCAATGLALPGYAAVADPALSARAAAQPDTFLSGITFTAPGFYGPQGRSLGRVPLAYPGLPERLAAFRSGGWPLANFEMETAAIFALGGAMGHRCGAVSVVLANRALGQFAPDPAAIVERLIDAGLDLMYRWE